MTVSLIRAVESHTGSSPSVSEASFTFAVGQVGDAPKGILIFVFQGVSNTEAITSVTYGGTTVPPLPNGRAQDTTTEPGSCKAFFLGASVPQGAQNVVVTRTNNTTTMYAVAYLEGGAKDLFAVTNYTLDNNAAMAQQSIVAGAGTTQIFAAAYSGGVTTPTGTSMTIGTGTYMTTPASPTYAFYSGYETTPTTGTRTRGLTCATDDLGYVIVTVGEIALVTTNMVDEYIGAYATGSSPGINSPLTTTWHDLKGNKDGTLTNFAGTTSDGWAGSGTAADPYALVDDGGGNGSATDKVALGDVGLVEDKNWAVEVWAKVNGHALGPVLWAEYDSSAGTAYAALAYDTSGTLWFAYKDTTTEKDASISGFDDNAWHHFVAVADGTNMYLYVDGYRRSPAWNGTMITVPSSTVATDMAVLMTAEIANTQPLTGRIASVRFHSTALAAVDVASNYAAGILAYGSTISNPVYCYGRADATSTTPLGYATALLSPQYGRASAQSATPMGYATLVNHNLASYGRAAAVSTTPMGYATAPLVPQYGRSSATSTTPKGFATCLRAGFGRAAGQSGTPLGYATLINHFLQSYGRASATSTTPKGYAQDVLPAYGRASSTSTTPMGYAQDVLYAFGRASATSTTPKGYAQDFLYSYGRAAAQSGVSKGFAGRALASFGRAAGQSGAPVGFGHLAQATYGRATATSATPLGYATKVTSGQAVAAYGRASATSATPKAWAVRQIRVAGTSSTQVNTAFSAASAGDIVYFPTGNYAHTGDLNVPTGVHVRGQGAGKSTLSCGVRFDTGSIIGFGGTESDGMTFGTAGSSYFYFVTGAHGIRFYHCRFRGAEQMWWVQDFTANWSDSVVKTYGDFHDVEWSYCEMEWPGSTTGRYFEFWFDSRSGGGNLYDLTWDHCTFGAKRANGTIGAMNTWMLIQPSPPEHASDGPRPGSSWPYGSNANFGPGSAGWTLVTHGSGKAATGGSSGYGFKITNCDFVGGDGVLGNIDLCDFLRSYVMTTVPVQYEDDVTQQQLDASPDKVTSKGWTITGNWFSDHVIQEYGRDVTYSGNTENGSSTAYHTSAEVQTHDFELYGIDNNMQMAFGRSSATSATPKAYATLHSTLLATYGRSSAASTTPKGYATLVQAGATVAAYGRSSAVSTTPKGYATTVYGGQQLAAYGRSVCISHTWGRGTLAQATYGRSAAVSATPKGYASTISWYTQVAAWGRSSAVSSATRGYATTVYGGQQLLARGRCSCTSSVPLSWATVRRAGFGRAYGVSAATMGYAKSKSPGLEWVFGRSQSWSSARGIAYLVNLTIPGSTGHGHKHPHGAVTESLPHVSSGPLGATSDGLGSTKSSPLGSTTSG